MIIRCQQAIRVEGGQNVYGSVSGSGEKFLAPNILNIGSGDELHIPPPALDEELILELILAAPVGSLLRLGYVRRPPPDVDTNQLRFW